MDINFTKDDIAYAYNKLKAHVYYDNGDLFIRKQLAIFEANRPDESIFFSNDFYEKHFPETLLIKLEEKFELIADAINNYHVKPDAFDKLLTKKLNINFLPKKFKSTKSPINFISNKRSQSKYFIERSSAFIDVPTELHLVTVLWISRFGKYLDMNLDSCSYGNRLLLNKAKDDIIKGSGLFKPYFKQYQNWRDNSVIEAQSQIKKGNNIIFLNLDIRDYYYSVKISLDDSLWGNPFYQSEINLLNIFKKIHSEYTAKLTEFKFPFDLTDVYLSNQVVLPIGLLSSYILGNYYLTEFDKNVKNKIKPAYYGRYVDDMLFVITNPSIDSNSEDKKLIENYIELELSQILEISDLPKYLQTDSAAAPSSCIKLRNYDNLICQTDKTLIYHFDAQESDLIIDKLKRELEERVSEFRDFPEENDKSSFEESAYHLLYDGTEGKIRTLKDYKENRYGLSVYLANRIFASIRHNKKENRNESLSILKFFKGLTSIDFFRLWEKIFTYFLVNKDYESFVDFYIHVFGQIQNIDDDYIPGTKLKGLEIKSNLYKLLDISFELVLALNPYFLKNTSAHKKLTFFQNEQRDWYSYMTQPFAEPTNEKSFHIGRFRDSNLIRHHYVIQPLINYTKLSFNKGVDLTDIALPKHGNSSEFFKYDFNEEALLNSPRPVKFWECCIAIIMKTISNQKIVKSDYTCSTQIFEIPLNDKLDEFYLNEAFELFKKINEKHFPPHIMDTEGFRDSIYKLSSISEDCEAYPNNIRPSEIHVNTSNSIQKPRLSFANTQVILGNMLASLRGKPNLNLSRYNTIQKIFKSTREEKADILLLPENFLPYELLSSLAKYSADNGILSVSGLEHWTFEKASYNFIVTILPVEINGQPDAVVVIRLKNHYSHGEVETIKGEKQLIPKLQKVRYDLFNWHNIYFTPYYCFELADSLHRSIFRSKIDLLIASEWNKDTCYFSNIVESLSRDLHAYIAQVNTSQYGDSRLTQPSKTEIKDILKLKGGDNDTILIGEIDLPKLREFQRKQYNVTKDDKELKPLPPDYANENAVKRIMNETIL